MVKVSYQQKPYRKIMMEIWGSQVYASPSNNTEFGRKVLEDDPDNSGSLGLAISEAMEDAVTHDNTRYTLGSVLNHVLLHQTVIGQEAIKQFEQIDDYPDIIFGCIGGGSSFSGAFYPFYYDKVSKHAPKDCEFMAVEPTACPSMTKGTYMYDHADVARMTPLFKMYTLGHTFIPPPIHAGGLRYHGKAPTLCLLHKEGKVGVKAYNQLEVFEAATLFSKTEGIIPAPEPSHAIKAAVDEALKCKETGEEKTIFFPLCGHGYFDMQAYDDYHAGKLEAYEYPKEKVNEAMKELRNLYPWINGK